MKILILSPDPWRKDNSFGNTYSSIFGKLENVEIAHVYLLDGLPDKEPNIKHYYQIPESKVIKTLFKFPRAKYRVGQAVFPKQNSNTVQKTIQRKSFYSVLLDFGKKKHWSILFSARELAWKYGNINIEGLLDFVKAFNPDIFFLPYTNVHYSNRLALIIKKNIDIPMVIEMAMDHYTLNRISWNPVFWIKRFSKRALIRRLVGQSEMMFVISKKLKQELEDELNIPCKVLYKTPDMTRSFSPYIPNDNKKAISFLFTGNIYANRWKSLAMLAHELQCSNYGHLDIYTATPISNAMQKALNIEGVSKIHPPVSQTEVIELQNNADILVHAEAFDKYNKSLVRCAISTKIMDYLSVGRCVLAIGPSDISSIEYLSDNNVALIASDESSLSGIINELKNNPSLIKEYADKGTDFISKHLNAEKLRQNLYDDLQRTINNYKNK